MWYTGHSAVIRHRVESDFSCQGFRFSMSDYTRASLQQLTDPLGTWPFQGNSEARAEEFFLHGTVLIFFFFFLVREVWYVFTKLFSGIVDFSTVGQQCILQHTSPFCKVLPLLPISLLPPRSTRAKALLCGEQSLLEIGSWRSFGLVPENVLQFPLHPSHITSK